MTASAAGQQRLLEDLLRRKDALSTQLQLAKQNESMASVTNALATPEGLALLMRREQANTRLRALSDELTAQSQAHESEMARLKAAVGRFS